MLDESSKTVSLHLPSNNPSFSVNLDMEFFTAVATRQQRESIGRHYRNTELYLCAPPHEQKLSLE